jgi:pimeloyl-ACP methyl ester carboxylesterase
MINLWIKSCNIFGASQWWMATQCIAIKHPNFIEKMVLWSTTCKIEFNALKIISRRIELAKLGDVSGLNERFLKDVYCKETIKKYWDIILQSNADITAEELQRFIKLAYTIFGFDIEHDLWNIKCKTLVIWSNNDLIFGWNSSRNLAEILHCELYLYDHYGHAVYDEAPDFREKMLKFLRD